MYFILRIAHQDLSSGRNPTDENTIGSDWAHGVPLSMFDNVAVLVNTNGAEKILGIITLAGATATEREQVRNILFAGTRG